MHHVIAIVTILRIPGFTIGKSPMPLQDGAIMDM
jgi:hypothetical protein